mmetsp:Transcript_22179/g.53211  ORF Transcript_22179/g.53211 Transcript_22179/m.53211 type:complete len:212 (+) Transcript_22179:238-873(+)
MLRKLLGRWGIEAALVEQSGRKLRHVLEGLLLAMPRVHAQVGINLAALPGRGLRRWHPTGDAQQHVLGLRFHDRVHLRRLLLLPQPLRILHRRRLLRRTGSRGAIGGDQVRDDHEDDFRKLAPEDHEASAESHFSRATRARNAQVLSIPLGILHPPQRALHGIRLLRCRRKFQTVSRWAEQLLLLLHVHRGLPNNRCDGANVVHFIRLELV